MHIKAKRNVPHWCRTYAGNVLPFTPEFCDGTYNYIKSLWLKGLR